MKTTSKSVSKIVLAALAGLFVFTGASSLMADTVYVYDAHRDFHRDHNAYWDRDNHYHHYVYYREHRGYWDYRGPVRVFVSCD